MVTAYIALGGNVGDVRSAFASGLRMLQEHGIAVVRISSIHQTEALVLPGSPPGPDFLNAVAEVQTDLSALELLDILLLIEQKHGRVRDKRWAPRTLDLDILLYGDEVINHPRLTIPHPAMHERLFVLIPLRELVPDYFFDPHSD